MTQSPWQDSGSNAWEQQPDPSAGTSPQYPGAQPAAYPGQAGGPGQLGSVPPAGYNPNLAGQPGQPAFFDAYGRPVYAVQQPPAAPKSPVMGIVAFALAILGSVAVFGGIVWILNDVDRLIAEGESYTATALSNLMGPLTLVQSFAGLGLLAALVLGIIATATNRGRLWGILGIVFSVVGPIVAASIGGSMISQRVIEWSRDAVESSGTALGMVLGF